MLAFHNVTVIESAILVYWRRSRSNFAETALFSNKREAGNLKNAVFRFSKVDFGSYVGVESEKSVCVGGRRSPRLVPTSIALVGKFMHMN